jgi:Xaa-Pro aminopeptidase
MDDVIWEGPLPSLSELANSAGIQHAQDIGALPEFLQQQLSKGRSLHYLPPYHADIALLLKKWLQINELSPSLDLVRAIVAQRSYKTEEEIGEMEAALEITRQIYQYAMAHTRPGRFEYEIVGAIEGIAKSNNGAMAYHPIFSVNGHVLHNHYHGRQMQDGQWIVADLGAENHRHYASDLTRTWPVNGRFSPVQKDVYQTVQAAYERAANALRPGITYRECHLMAWETIAEGLKNMGILKGDPAEMAQLGVPGLFMPHGLGHMIGLDVHDMENLGEQYVGYAEGQTRSTLLGLKSLRLAKSLEAGFVLTVEPGIYFIPPLIARWEAEGQFKDFIQYDRLRAFQHEGGCRIEDNYFITADGARKLGPHVPRTLAEVEAAVGSA